MNNKPGNQGCEAGMQGGNVDQRERRREKKWIQSPRSRVEGETEHIEETGMERSRSGWSRTQAQWSNAVGIDKVTKGHFLKTEGVPAKEKTRRTMAVGKDIGQKRSFHRGVIRQIKQTIASRCWMEGA